MIYICSDIAYAKEVTLEKLSTKMYKLYDLVELKVDDAKEIIKESYIAESEQKYIVICATSFNLYAQNALLKLLEEPPRNITFIIITKSKSALLPTVRSRMQIEVIKAVQEETPLDIDIKKASLKEIFEFLKAHSYDSKDKLKELVEKIIKVAISELKLEFNQSEYDMFDKLLNLANLNSRSQNILSYLLILIHRKKNENKKTR